MDEEPFFKDQEKIDELIVKLHNYYTNYEDKVAKHAASMDGKPSERLNKVVYYAKPTTVFCKHPDIQAKYRKEMIQKISEIPSPVQTALYADSLLSEYKECKLRSQPNEVRLTLASFFLEECKYIQQYKFKYLLRWLFGLQHNPDFMSLDEVNRQIESFNKKLDDYLIRFERLRNNEGFNVPATRPSPKTEEGTNLFVEDPSVSFSNISRDDIQEYISTNAGRLSEERPILHYFSRVKWLWVGKRFEIWKSSQIMLCKLKDLSKARMRVLLADESYGVFTIKKSLVINKNNRNLKRQREMMRIARAGHSTIAEEQLNVSEELLKSHIDELDLPPTLFTKDQQLENLIERLTKEFSVIGDLKMDEGKTLHHLVTHLFEDMFNYQKQQMDFLVYDIQSSSELQQARLSNMRVHRVSSVRKAYANTDISAPVLTSKQVRKVALKPADWLKKICLTPRVPVYAHKNRARLANIKQIDTLLENAFKFLEIQDFSTAEKVLKEFSLTYNERASKKGSLKTELDLSDKDLTIGFLSAQLKDQSSNRTQEHEEEKVNLHEGTVEALYILRFLKSRNARQRLLEILNAYRSYQRTLNMHVSQLESRENLKPDSPSEELPPSYGDHNPTVPAGSAITYFFPQNMPELYGTQDVIDDKLSVKDETGQFILYKESLEDLEGILQELLRLGSHYIEKYECWTAEEGDNFPAIDRDWMAGELLDEELKFQELKMSLVTVYFELFEHSIVKEDQLKVAQIIISIMAWRPRLNLRASYFTQGYWSHCEVLEAHLELVKSVLGHCKSSDESIQPRLHKISGIYDLIDSQLSELTLICKTPDATSQNTLETALWKAALSEWWTTCSNFQYAFEDGILIDQAELVVSIAHELSGEVALGQWRILPKIDPDLFYGQTGRIQEPVISELQLLCNAMELWRFRHILERSIEESKVLEEIYKKQCLILKKDFGTLEPADWNIGLKHNPQVDEGPGSRSNLSLPLFELDGRMRAFINFSSFPALKYNLLNWGLTEMQSLTQYQVMHMQLLQIGVQVNQAGSDKWHRLLREVQLAKENKYVPRRSKTFWNTVLGKKGEGLIPDKVEAELTRIQTRLVADSSKFFFNIKEKKIKARPGLDLAFKRIGQKYLKVLENNDSLPYVIRNLRFLLVNGYCKDILRDAYHEAIKLQLIKVSREYKKVLEIVPNEFKSHYFRKDNIFYDEERGLVNPNFLPSTGKILNIKGLRDEDKPLWSNWSPFKGADTSEVQRQRNLTKKEQIRRKSIFVLSNTWQFPSLIARQLEIQICLLRSLQARLFLNFMNEDGMNVLELYDKSASGENYWEKEEDTPREFSHKAVEQMLEAQSPRFALEGYIKDSLNFLLTMASDVQKIAPEEHIKYVLLEAERSFRKLGAALYHCYESSLSENSIEARKILYFISEFFRLARRKCRFTENALAPLFGELQCSMIIQYAKTMFIDHNREQISIGPEGAFMSNYEWGLAEICSESRSLLIAATTASEIKVEQYLASAGLHKAKVPLEVLEGEVKCLNTANQMIRLRTALFALKTGHDYVLDSVAFESVIQLYRETIELSSQLNPNSRDNKILGRTLSEVRIMREIFEGQILAFAIKFVLKETAKLEDAALAEGSHGVIEDFSCNVDRSYADMTRKVGVLHNFLNTLRNRCTVVDAPSCGKALVFSVRDMSTLAHRFSEQMLRYAESEFRAREEVSKLEQEHLEQQLKLKNKQLEQLRNSTANMRANMESLVNAQLSQKGNQLIYELDIANRQLQEIKGNMRHLEEQIKHIVFAEFRDELELKDRVIHDLRQSFKEYKGGLAQELINDIDGYKKDAFSEIRTKHVTSKPNVPLETLIAQDSEEVDGRKERDLVKMQETIRKMRIMHQWSKLHSKQNFEKQLKEIRENMSSNQYLWEQLHESQRREALLKQELSFTQQALGAAEKLADKLQTQIEDMNSQRLRLQQYKVTKGRRLNELEDKLKNYKKYEHVDNRKVLTHFYQQNKMLHQLKNAELEAGRQYLSQHTGYQRQINSLKTQLKKEKQMKVSAFDQLSQMREEIQGLDQDPDSLSSLWKNRYFELMEELKKTRDENECYREKLVRMGEEAFVAQVQDIGKQQDPIKSRSKRSKTPYS